MFFKTSNVQHMFCIVYEIQKETCMSCPIKLQSCKLWLESRQGKANRHSYLFIFFYIWKILFVFKYNWQKIPQCNKYHQIFQPCLLFHQNWSIQVNLIRVERLRQPACSTMINVKSPAVFADGNAALEISKARQKAVQTVVSEACLAFLMTLPTQLFVPESFKDGSFQVEFKRTSKMLNALLFCLNNKYLAVQHKGLFLLLKAPDPSLPRSPGEKSPAGWGALPWDRHA